MTKEEELFITTMMPPDSVPPMMRDDDNDDTTTLTTPALLLEMEDDENAEKICRICLETDCPEDMIAPCNCKGSSKWVHRDCLDMWRIHEKDRAFSKCTECLTDYKLYTTVKDDSAHPCCCCNPKQMKYWWFVSRDVVTVTLLVQFVIAALGWIVWMMDTNQDIVTVLAGNRTCPNDTVSNTNTTSDDRGASTSSFSCNHTLSIYYVCGLFLLLVLMGCIGSVVLCFNKCSIERSIATTGLLDNIDNAEEEVDGDDEEGVQQQQQQQQQPRGLRYQMLGRRPGYRRHHYYCHDPCYCCCCDTYPYNYYYYPYYPNHHHRGGAHYHTSSSCCEGTDGCCGGCSGACDINNCSGGGSGSGSGGNNGGHHILIIILLVVVVVMAIIGFFIGIVTAVLGCQRILQRHLHILHKRRLVEEFAVMDLSIPKEEQQQDWELAAPAPSLLTDGKQRPISGEEKTHLKTLGLME